MHPRTLLRSLRPALVAVAAAAFSACQSDNPAPLDGNPINADLSIGLDVSSRSVKAGSQVAVAVHAYSPEALGALQGFLRYDPGSLRYVGQAPEGRTMVMLNSNRAAQGELRVLSLNVETGLPARTGTLVFEVLKPDYASSLRYEFETAGDQKATKAITKYSVARGVLEAPDLVVPEHAVPMTVADWNQLLYPAEYAAA